MRLYEIQGFGACTDEQMLMEGWLDSVKKSLGDKIDQTITSVTNTASALQVFYKIGTNKEYLETCTYEIKRAIKRKVKRLRDSKIGQIITKMVNKIWPDGRSLMDFLKGVVIVAVLNVIEPLVTKFRDALTGSAANQVMDLIKQLSGVDRMVGNLTSATGIFTVLDAIGVANNILFELLDYINKKILGTKVAGVTTV